MIVDNAFNLTFSCSMIIQSQVLAYHLPKYPQTVLGLIDSFEGLPADDILLDKFPSLHEEIQVQQSQRNSDESEIVV